MTTSTTDRHPRRLGLRGRIVISMVGIVALALASLIALTYGLVRADNATRANEDVVQELREFRQFTQNGVDPETGEPFADPEGLLETFLSRQQPSSAELIVGRTQEGQVLQVSGASVGDTRQLLADTALWHDIRSGDSGVVETPLGEARYGNATVTVGGSRGTLTVLALPHRNDEVLTAVVRRAAPVALVALLLTGVAAWFLAGRVLTPLRRFQGTAQEISERDLTRRLEVSGNDEVADLGRTFNGVLDRLEEAFASQRQFVDDAGHELRTPITIIRGHLELMGDDPVEREETLALVTSELDRMSRMVADLLTLAKADRPDHVRRSPQDVAALTLELDSNVQRLGPRDWVLDEVAEGTAAVDGQRLAQAVLQLARNAVQHTAEGDRIHLASRWVEREPGRWFLELAVTDHGPGVPAGQEQRVFERFHRSEGASHHHPGAGLGLPIVRAIAEGHGGTVEVSETPGGGATFTLSVPTPGHVPTTHDSPDEDA
ncbi:sensor histidine kinase [Kytococcus schroeteri]|nr:ATP-binding protein [Kytococcus schroeteri]